MHVTAIIGVIALTTGHVSSNLSGSAYRCARGESVTCKWWHTSQANKAECLQETVPDHPTCPSQFYLCCIGTGHQPIKLYTSRRRSVPPDDSAGCTDPCKNQVKTKSKSSKSDFPLIPVVIVAACLLLGAVSGYAACYACIQAQERDRALARAQNREADQNPQQELQGVYVHTELVERTIAACISNKTAPSAQCTICLNAICQNETSTDNAAIALPCCHSFHKACISEWWLRGQSKMECPVCKSAVHVPKPNQSVSTLTEEPFLEVISEDTPAMDAETTLEDADTSVATPSPPLSQMT